MAKITEIKPAMPKLPTRKRVAAYARVSMETERLHHSLSAQVSYYSSLIQSNPEWIYAGVYAEIIVPYMIRLRFRDFVKECKNLLIYRLSHTEGCAEGLFFCLLFSTDYFERVQVGVHAGDFAHPYNDGTPHNDLQDDLL